jgi:hypothetical protein
MSRQYFRETLIDPPVANQTDVTGGTTITALWDAPQPDLDRSGIGQGGPDVQGDGVRHLHHGCHGCSDRHLHAGFLKFAAINNAAASGDTTLVAAVAGKRYIVVNYAIVATGAVA